MSRRLKNLLYFSIVLIIEVIIALFVNDNIIRPYIGDVLVVIMIYFFIRILLIKEISWLPLYIFAFAVGVELCQFINIVGILGIENNKFARIIIGSTFDLKDIVCYFVGCCILFGYEKIVTNNGLSNSAHNSK